MRRILVVFLYLLSVLLAQTAPLSFLVFDTRTAQPGQLPEGWQLKVNRGAADISTLGEPGGIVLHFRSRKSSFGLERPLDIDVSQYPYLSWRWRVQQLPRHGDFRRTTTDDQAAQILVLFSDRHVISYVWDSNAPQGAMQASNSVPLLHIASIVCRSGAAELNRWISESRNLADDYRKAFGRQPARVKGIRLQINTQHTGASAESDFGEVEFRSIPQ